MRQQNAYDIQGLLKVVPAGSDKNPEAEEAYSRYVHRQHVFAKRMKEIAQQLSSALDGFLESDILQFDWNYSAGPDQWSRKEIIGHLIDSAQINLQRFVRCTYSEQFTLTYDQVEWVEAQHYRSADMTELLELWRLLNRQIIRVLENYPTDRLQVTCDTGKNAVSFHTVEALALDYVDHLNHHLKSIRRV